MSQMIFDAVPEVAIKVVELALFRKLMVQICPNLEAFFGPGSKYFGGWDADVSCGKTD